MSEAEIRSIGEAVLEADRALVAALEARAEAIARFVAIREASPESYARLPPVEEAVRNALEASERFPRPALERVIREVAGACASMVAPVRVAVVGPEGGFGSIAARAEFGVLAQLSSHASVAAVFDDVARGRVDHGVVPFETSSDGALAETLRALVATDAVISSERTIACTYDLVSTTGNAGDIEKIYGTHAALAACERGLAEFDRAAALDVLTGGTAIDFARDDHGAAALVAGWSEDDPQGLRLVRERIEDRIGVETRFVVVGARRPARTGNDRTILALGVGEAPGSLHRALSPFADRGINLTRIESRRALESSWRYLFVVELDGHVTDRAVLTAVDEVRAASRHVKILGSYPR